MEWHDIFEVLNGKKLQPRISYPASLSFTSGGEVKSFTDKQKLEEFIIAKLASQILKGPL